MNMGFQKPIGTELELFRQPARESGIIRDASSAPRPNRLKRVIWLLVAAAVVYFLTTISVDLLWGLAAVGLGLIALAVAVCIHAQNNTR
jgi:fatty acid desaturase